jgi:hypothetical protein
MEYPVSDTLKRFPMYWWHVGWGDDLTDVTYTATSISHRMVDILGLTHLQLLLYLKP